MSTCYLVYFNDIIVFILYTLCIKTKAIMQQKQYHMQNKKKPKK